MSVTVRKVRCVCDYHECQVCLCLSGKSGVSVTVRKLRCVCDCQEAQVCL